MPKLFILFVILLSWSASSDLITHRAKLSSKRDGVGGIRVADHFYFAGGFELHDSIPTNITEIYNVVSGAFEDPIFLEEPRAHISTAVIGQNIYFIGGVKDAASCAMMYNTTIHQYEDIGCGPTFRLALQVSAYNSTVTVLGSFSADFYDASNGWYYRPKLTYWMQSMGLGALLVHENLIIGIGGVNTTTLEPIYDAWIYDTYTDNLTVFDNITTDEMTSTYSGFIAAHDRIVIYFADRFFVHQFGTIEWHEDFMPNITNAVILPDVLFMFNMSGYSIYNWTSMEPQWSSISVYKIYAFDNQVVIDLKDRFLIYEAGTFTNLNLEYSIQNAVQWGDKKYVFHTDSRLLRLYDSQTKTISYLSPALSLVSSLVPFNESTLVIFQSTINARIYNLVNDTLSDPVAVGMSKGVLLGTDIVSNEDKVAWINLGETLALSFTVVNSFADGIFIYGPQRIDYFYIDVFNHVTREWQPRIPMTNLTFSIGTAFAPVVVIDDMMVVGKRTRTYWYNTTSGESYVTSLTGASWPTNRAVNTVPVTNHVGHLPGISSSAIITVNVTAVIIRDDLQLGSISAQYVTSYDNVIYIAVSNGLYYNLNTYDIATSSFDTVLLPSPQASMSLALINDTLIALGNDGSVYGLLRSDRSTWYQTPLQNNFVRPIFVAIDANTIMVAAGKDITLKVYTDELVFINATAVIDLGIKITTNEPNANAEPTGTAPDNSPGQSGLTQGELAAAIVVPIVVGVGGLIALTIILIKKRNPKNKAASNTLGLETRYGAWFTPFDQITFGEQLGQGGSGQVFKGKWKNTTVALKLSMTEANNSVITELELMMQLRPHPNVVQLLGFSVHPETNSIILIIEFCDGGSLDTKLYDNRDEIPLQTRVQWLTGVAKGLYHLHSNKIVHRDVAARNVLVHRNEPKLTDFGMSRLVDEQKQHGTTKSELGPIRWMSPESLKNKEYSTNSDIWSFGILMFEVIARLEPHHEADSIEIGRQIRDEGLTPVIPLSCPSQLAEIMKQCWQMSPQSRPKIESLIQLLEALQE